LNVSTAIANVEDKTAVFALEDNEVSCCPFTVSNIVTTLLCDNSYGHVEFVPNGGIPPYTYDLGWKVTTNPIVKFATAGLHSVTITDANCCSVLSSFIIPGYNRPNAFTTTTASTATITPYGNAPFTYLWSDGQTTPIATGLSQGLYPFTVTDANGCDYKSSVTIAASCAFSVNITYVSSFCAGVAVGGLSAVPVGGNAPFNYIWNTGATTATISNLALGIYTVEVTDNSGCKVFKYLDQSYVQEIIYTTSSTATTASVHQTPPAPYSLFYVWDNGQTTATATGLSTGSHCVTISRINNWCPSVTCITNTNCPLTTSFILDSSCGCTNGNALTVYAQGGIPPYSYLWENGTTNATASNLGTGFHVVTISDGTSCITVDSSEIYQYPTLETYVQFYGTNANSNTVGGSYPYSFLWSTGETTFTIDSLSHGTYCLSVTDGNGCTTVSCGYFSNTCQVTGHIYSNNVCCPKACDGSAEVVVAGGSFPYSYLWSTGGNTKIVTGLCEGTYTVTVTDNSGCQLVLTDSIQEPNEIKVLISGVSLCDSTCSGILTATAVGGRAPYTYYWNNGATTPSISGQCPGIFSVTVTDIAGCIAGNVDTLFQSMPYTVSTATIDASCHNACDGSSTILVSSGIPPYTYYWIDGQSTPTATGLCAGTFNLTVLDAYGCYATASTIVLQPDLVSLSMSMTPVSVPSGSDGSGTVVAVGGTPSYTYNWDNGETSPTVTALSAGNHCVTVTDAQGCTNVGCVFVGGGAMNNESTVFSHIEVIPNPASDFIYIHFNLLITNDLYYRLYNVNGQLLMDKQLSNIRLLNERLSVDHLAKGIYLLKIVVGQETVVRKICLQ